MLNSDGVYQGCVLAVVTNNSVSAVEHVIGSGQWPKYWLLRARPPKRTQMYHQTAEGASKGVFTFLGRMMKHQTAVETSR